MTEDTKIHDLIVKFCTEFNERHPAIRITDDSDWTDRPSYTVWIYSGRGNSNALFYDVGYEGDDIESTLQNAIEHASRSYRADAARRKKD